MQNIDALTFKEMVNGGARMLELYRRQVDELNVFPVPDGDTGTNMTLTISSAIKEVNTVDSEELSELTTAFSKGALKGARGNSGVILSQILKGFSKVCADKTELSSKDFAESLKVGTEIAYGAVTKPKEGTILTVIRVIAESAVSLTKRKTPPVDELLSQLLEVGEDILDKTTDMLPVLKKAGVVDAGGKGLMCVLKGFYTVLSGAEFPTEAQENVNKPVAISSENEVDQSFFDNDYLHITYAYCTEYFVNHIKRSVTEADVDKLRDDLLKIGDCVLVIGDVHLIKVHVHTNNPDMALKFALKLGEIDSVKIENMLQQNRALRGEKDESEEPLKDMATVAVCAGEGFGNIFTDLGADYVVSGGQSMNPSVYDILDAVNKVKAKNVFVLPNNSNIILAAEQTVGLAESRVLVVPSKSMPEGIAAMLSYNPDAGVDENFNSMSEGCTRVKTGEITHAVRKTRMDGFSVNVGDVIGVSAKKICAKGSDVDEVVLSTLATMTDDDTAQITLYFGEDVTAECGAALQQKVEEKYPDCDVFCYDGGQPNYFYLLSVE